MDILIMLAIGVLIVLAAIIALVMLRRSWGDFPSRSSLPTTPPSQPSPGSMLNNSLFDMPEPTNFDDVPSGAAGGLVLITNPHIRRAAEQALRQNDQAARYFTRDGEQIYFNADAIADPQERQTAYRVMQRLGTDERIDLRDIQQVLQIIRRQ